MIPSRLNMSLLPALKAILETVSVTEAAALTSVTQSTMSRTLGQLRDILHDPILVRTGNQIYLSEKALRIRPLVSRLVSESEILFSDQTFAPEECDSRFRIAASSNIQRYFLVPALLEVNKLAPNMTFTVSNNNHRTVPALQAGELDIGIVHFLEGMDEQIPMKTIAKSAAYVLVRREHPLAKSGLSEISQLDAFPFIATYSPLQRHETSDKLRNLSKSLKNPWLSLAVQPSGYDLVKNTDSFMLTGLLTDPGLKTDPNLVLLPLPAYFPMMELKLMWPDHWQFNNGHTWLRETLSDQLIGLYLNLGMKDSVVGLDG